MTVIVNVAVPPLEIVWEAGVALIEKVALGVQLASRFPTSIEPRPVTSSYPGVTRYPARPPDSPVAEGVLLLHMLGVVSTHAATPLDATVTSWKTPFAGFAASW